MVIDPPHPGAMLRADVFEPLGLGVTHAAQKLGVSRVALSRVLNGRAAVSADLAIRLERAGVSTARFWLNSQMNYELARASSLIEPRVERLLAA